VVLLWLSASVDYIHGLIIDRYPNSWQRHIALISSLTINLGLLGIFKYADFFYQTINSVLGTNFMSRGFDLPIGISFYTFQTISYVVDVYRGDVESEKSYLNFLLFVSLFHQLVAGPIVRYSEISTEIGGRKHSLAEFSSGITRFATGLFKKVAIANIAAVEVASFLDQQASMLSVAGAWYGLLMYAIQIYFDFSGYSDMAIGLGMMFGFHYNENFNHPYISRSVTEFWRRWHISLSTFFRDYLYIPLGGNRRHLFRNLFVVWFLTGLWHGASWNFVLWGLYYGILLAIEKIGLLKILEKLPRLFGHVYLIFVVLIGWAIFYFTDFNKLHDFIHVLFGLQTNKLITFKVISSFKEHLWWLIGTIILCLPVRTYLVNYLYSLKQQKSAWTPIGKLALITANFVFIVVSIALLVGNTYNPFIYFRF